MRALSLAALFALTTTAAYAQTAMASNPISQSLKSAWDGAKKNIKESAEQMPEDGYAFKPIDTVRTFGQILAHVAGANYVFCGTAKGDKTAREEDAIEKSAKSKADIIKALDASLAYCDAAFASVDDKSAGEMVDMPYGMPKSPRATPLIVNIGHLDEHYGNLVTYFRIKGMVPPSSKRN
jgi:uncharacterized damage-inducible protein DinB